MEFNESRIGGEEKFVVIYNWNNGQPTSLDVRELTMVGLNTRINVIKRTSLPMSFF